MASKSSSLHVKDFSEYEKKKSEAIEKGTFQYEFLATHFGGVESFFRRVATDDIISELKGIRSSGATVKKWAPKRAEGFHAHSLELAMRVRYAGYGKDGLHNVKGLYALAASDKRDQSKLAQLFERIAFKWEEA